MENLAPNQPLYLYQIPMFMVTVSVVLISDNRIVVMEDKEHYRFPGGHVKAGMETIQFAAIRTFKENTGLTLQKDYLMPCDFRSDPSRSKEKNIVDFGMIVTSQKISEDFHWNSGVKLIEIDFEKKQIIGKKEFYMDHQKLLERAIEVCLMFDKKDYSN